MAYTHTYVCMCIKACTSRTVSYIYIYIYIERMFMNVLIPTGFGLWRSSENVYFMTGYISKLKFL